MTRAVWSVLAIGLMSTLCVLAAPVSGPGSGTATAAPRPAAPAPDLLAQVIAARY